MFEIYNQLNRIPMPIICKQPSKHKCMCIDIYIQILMYKYIYIHISKYIYVYIYIFIYDLHIFSNIGINENGINKKFAKKGRPFYLYAQATELI
jgi:hypothetical protein